MDQKQKEIGDMFDQIAHAYDLNNGLLSFGQDARWRKKLAQNVSSYPHEKILDVATGTGDVLFSLSKNKLAFVEAIGIDISHNMITKAKKKAVKRNLHKKITFIQSDACDIPFADSYFDALTISFGIRNITQLKKALKEFHRVLKTKGTLVVMEFSLPRNFFIRQIYLFYFRYVLPLIGGIISRNMGAYKYLNKSVEGFYDPDTLGKIVEQAGFTHEKTISLSFGIASVLIWRKN